jgi:hypothetical protein
MGDRMKQKRRDNMRTQSYYEELIKIGLSAREYCNEEEQKAFKEMDDKDLPDDIFWDSFAYFRYGNYKAPREAMRDLILIRTGKYIKTIRNCIFFFLVLAIIGIIFAVLDFAL